MKLDFQPISSVKDAEEVLGIIEIRSLFHGLTYIADLEWDEDALLASFLDQVEDTKLREDYTQERAVGIQEAKDHLLSDLRRLIEERHGSLGENSPFEWRFHEEVLLERKEFSALTMAGIGYLWLSLHWLLQSEKDYLVVAVEDAEAFRRAFTAVFEQICCYAISGRQPTAVWYFGAGRSVKDFLSRLRDMTAACGNGQVKSFNQLERNQIGANDAGVDLIAIEVQGGQIRRNALAFLVGATLQKSDRRGKIMGMPEVNRFTAYFQRAPLLAYKGVLAIPFARSEIEELNCRDQDCLYIPREEMILFLGQAPTAAHPGRLRYPAALLRRATNTLAKSLVMASNDADRSLNVAS
nr:hypothetical protein [Brevundimonas naejangsanensis]